MSRYGYLSIGSNMGNRLRYLREAVQLLSKVLDVKLVAPIFTTAPWGKIDQDDFLNSVVAFESADSAHEVLTIIQNVEHQLGRVRQEHWGARVIDIDLLFYGQEEVSDERLTLPHPYVYERLFVLEPLKALLEQQDPLGIQGTVDKALIKCRPSQSVQLFLPQNIPWWAQ